MTTLQPQQPPLQPLTTDVPATMSLQPLGPPSSFNWNYAEAENRNDKVHCLGVVVLAVLSLLLFATLLYIYIKWACRYRHMAAATTAGSLRASQGLSAGNGCTISTGLDREKINGFPVRLHGKSTEVKCSICLSNIVEGEKVKMLPGCGHGFHPECVDEWLGTQPTCPLCRASLVALPALMSMV